MENSTTLKAISMKSQQGSRDVTPFDAVSGVNDIDIGNAIEVRWKDVNLVLDTFFFVQMFKANVL